MAQQETIEIDPTLEAILRTCIDEAKKRLESEGQVVPFSALAVGKELQMQQHSADDPSDSFAAARKRVAAASKSVKAYAVCYDGFIEVDNKLGEVVQRDCIIAEGGLSGEEYGHAIGLVYRVDDDGNITFNKNPLYVSKSLNYMASSTLESSLGIETFTGAAEPDQD